MKKATENHFTKFLPRIIMESRKLMSEHNGVKGAFLFYEDGSSPGRVSREKQVGYIRMGNLRM